MPPVSTDPEADLSRSARALRRHFDRDARLTKAQIGERLGCTPRHALRVVDELRAAGVDIRDEPAGRSKQFYVPAEHQRRQIQIEALDEEALRALTVAAEASRTLLRGTPLDAPLGRAFATLLDAVGDEEVYSFDPEEEGRHWHFGNAAAPGAGRLDILRALDQAIVDGQTVRIAYTNGRGERSARLLDPLAVAPFPSGWQLAAFCHVRREVRNFNPVRIASVEPVPDVYFFPPAGFDADAHFGGRFGALDGGAGRLHTVRLRVAPGVTQHFHTRDYHTSQRAEPDPERPGGLLVTFQVPELKTMRSFVRSWGPHVVALAPPALVADLADDARRTADAYRRAAVPVG